VAFDLGVVRPGTARVSRAFGVAIEISQSFCDFDSDSDTDPDSFSVENEGSTWCTNMAKGSSETAWTSAVPEPKAARVTL
jgi:hypothetical protein